MSDTLRRQCILELHYELTSDIFRGCNGLHSCTQSVFRASFVLVCFDSVNMNGLFVSPDYFSSYFFFCMLLHSPQL